MNEVQRYLHQSSSMLHPGVEKPGSPLVPLVAGYLSAHTLLCRLVHQPHSGAWPIPRQCQIASHATTMCGKLLTSAPSPADMCGVESAAHVMFDGCAGIGVRIYSFDGRLCHHSTPLCPLAGLHDESHASSDQQTNPSGRHASRRVMKRI